MATLSRAMGPDPGGADQLAAAKGCLVAIGFDCVLWVSFAAGVALWLGLL